MAEYDVIIVGAGISGLSLAHFCAKAGFKTLVLEKSDRVGGAIHSHSFDDDAADFWLELGAHTCYNSYANLVGILEDDALVNRLLKRVPAAFKMLAAGDLKSIPSQLAWLSLLVHGWRIFTLKKQGQSLRSYYSRLVGEVNYERVLSQAFSAVVSQPADDFPADLLFKKRARRKDVLKKFTFAGGLSTITDRIAAEKNIEVVTGAGITAINVEGGRVFVASGDQRYEGAYLAVATPASVAGELLREAFPDISEKLTRITVHKVETVGVAVDKNNTSITRFSNLIPEDDIFFSVVSRDVVPNVQFRGFTFHFKPGMADDEAKLKRVSDLLKVKREDLTRVVAKDNFVPALRVGHQELVAEIDNLCVGTNLFLTGNYFYGIAVEDCVNRSLSEFNRLAEPVQ